MVSLRSYSLRLSHRVPVEGKPGWLLGLDLVSAVPPDEAFIARAAQRFLATGDDAITRILEQASQQALAGAAVPPPPDGSAHSARSWALALLHRIDDGLTELGHALLQLEVRAVPEGRPGDEEFYVAVSHPRWPSPHVEEGDLGPASSEISVVLVTVPDAESGARIARTVVEERLAACVNVLPGVRSIYHWQGKICDEPEGLLVIKTATDRFPALMRRLKQLHPYSVPEILAFRPHDGWPDYPRWVCEATRAVPPTP